MANTLFHLHLVCLIVLRFSLSPFLLKPPATSRGACATQCLHTTLRRCGGLSRYCPRKPSWLVLWVRFRLCGWAATVDDAKWDDILHATSTTGLRFHVLLLAPFYASTTFLLFFSRCPVSVALSTCIGFKNTSFWSYPPSFSCSPLTHLISRSFECKTELWSLETVVWLITPFVINCSRCFRSSKVYNLTNPPWLGRRPSLAFVQWAIHPQYCLLSLASVSILFRKFFLKDLPR